jgi:hypothetical protein
MKKVLNSILYVALTVCVCLSGSAFVSNDADVAPSGTTNAGIISLSSDVEAPSNCSTAFVGNLSNVTAQEISDADSQGLAIVGKIDNPYVISQMADAGLVAVRDGKLPEYIITYAALDEEPDADEMQLRTGSAQLSCTKSNQYDGIYIDEYDVYTFPTGTLTATYTQTKTTNWTSSATGSITAGGTVFTLVEIKASVSGSMSYSIGTSQTKSAAYTVTCPAGKTCQLKVWMSYRVWDYTNGNIDIDICV